MTDVLNIPQGMVYQDCPTGQLCGVDGKIDWVILVDHEVVHSYATDTLQMKKDFSFEAGVLQFFDSGKTQIWRLLYLGLSREKGAMFCGFFGPANSANLKRNVGLFLFENAGQLVKAAELNGVALTPEKIGSLLLG